MSPAADHHRCCGKRSCCARQLSRIFQHICNCTRRHVHSVCTTRPHTMLCAPVALMHMTAYLRTHRTWHATHTALCAAAGAASIPSAHVLLTPPPPRAGTTCRAARRDLVCHCIRCARGGQAQRRGSSGCPPCATGPVCAQAAGLLGVRSRLSFPLCTACPLAAALRGGCAGRRRPTICLLRVLPHLLGAAATAALRLREEMWRVYTSHMHALYCQPVYRTMRGDRPTYIQISAKLPVITLGKLITGNYR